MQVPMPVLVVVAALTMAHAARAGQRLPGEPSAAPPCGACVVLVVPPTSIEELPAVLNGLEILIEVPAGSADLSALVGAIIKRGGRPGLIVRPAPGAGNPIDAQLPPGISTVILDIRAWSLPHDALVFALRRMLTVVRAGAPADVRLGIQPSADARRAVEEDAGAYWDFVVSDGVEPGSADRWVDAGDLRDAARALEITTERAAARWILRVTVGSDAVRAVLNDLAISARWLPAGLTPATNAPRIVCAGRTQELFLDPESLEMVALARGCGPEARVAIRPDRPFLRVPLWSGDTIVRVPEASGERFVEGVEVSASRRLTVGEIVARHQAAAARQSDAVRTLISSGTLTLTFEAPGFPAPVTVASRTAIYRDAGRTDLEQQDLLVNGLAFQHGRVPRLPILEPERVAAPPLVITLGDAYRYRLIGEETRGAVRCHVVAFEPRSNRETSFRGRVWIAADDFGLVRVEATQTGLRGPIVASEQTDDFLRTAAGVWLLSRSEVSQLYQGAAYRTPIHRVLALADHEVNSADFAQRRAAAYATDHPILRDTPSGYRYLDGAARTALPPESVMGGLEAPAPPARPALSAGSRVRTLAYGVILDPNITRPLPFAGLSYVDFNLFGTGTQLNAFFGGTYGQVAFSVPSLGGTRWQLAGRGFGIASSYNDRVFTNGREQYGQDIRQRPALASAWLLHPVTSRVSFRAGYEIEYTHLARIDATDADFVVPADQVSHALRLEIDAQRRGWDTSVWWSPARRSGWRAWGPAGGAGFRPAARDFQRYGATVARSVIVSPRMVVRTEGSAMAGRDLDRFSRYTFGAFENRLRGYPAALIRYDRGAVLRTAVAWSAAPGLRLDLFGDAAFVHDDGFGPGSTRFTGIGAAVEMPAPFGMLLAAEWGYGAQGVNTDGRRGTQVVRISGYKVF